MAYDLIVAKDGHHVSKGEVPDMPDYFGPNTYLSVTIAYVPFCGAYVEYSGKSYVILRVQTMQEKPTEMTHIMTCLEIDDEGLEVGQSPITLNSDMSGITVL